MIKLNSTIKFIFTLAKFQTELARSLDASLGGISFNELIILYHLSQADDNKLRRIDLANKVGLTASGITRLLLPMEKIGLIKKEANVYDARVSFVILAPGGKTKLTEGLERVEIFCEDLMLNKKTKKIEELSKLIIELEKNI